MLSLFSDNKVSIKCSLNKYLNKLTHILTEVKFKTWNKRSRIWTSIFLEPKIVVDIRRWLSCEKMSIGQTKANQRGIKVILSFDKNHENHQRQRCDCDPESNCGFSKLFEFHPSDFSLFHVVFNPWVEWGPSSLWDLWLQIQWPLVRRQSLLVHY